jgi:hypothetical protein
MRVDDCYRQEIDVVLTPTSRKNKKVRHLQVQAEFREAE